MLLVPSSRLLISTVCAAAVLAGIGAAAQNHAPPGPARKSLATVRKKAGAVKTKAVPEPKLTEQQKALHVLNRLTFGARPGDVDRVLAGGIDRWIEQQLQPEGIDDSALKPRLAPYRTLQMPTNQMAEAFPPQGMLRAIADGRKPMPNVDETHRKIYEVQIARIEQEKQRQAAQVNASAAAPAVAPSKEDEDAVRQKLQDDARQIADGLINLPKNQRLQTLFRNPAEKLINFPNLLRDDQRGRLLNDFNPEEREAFLSLNNPTGVVTSELQQAKVLRATFSERQLEEVMTDFWFNHFNIFLNKDADQYYTTAYERDVIRPHALEKFKDLLVATATSPAMLFYLDNASSVGPDSAAARPPNRRPNAPPPKPQPRPGLNENYGRELMELHTLSVDGGYSQADVTEAAKVFTGWTIDHPEWGGGFIFDPRRHEPGDKHLLGATIREGGQDEGMQLLDMLAHSPSTAKFISSKLAQRFVADDPPPALVAKLAETFTATDGDIREMLRTLFKSKEFWSARSYRDKVKTPLEFVVSALRASGAQIDNPNVVVQTLQRMGMPLYGMQPPTGYSMRASAWFNPDALVDRLNFAIALSTGKLGGIKVDPERLFVLSVLAGADNGAKTNPAKKIASVGKKKKQQTEAAQPDGMQTALALMEQALLGSDVSDQTQATLRNQLQDAKLTGELLENPANSLGVISGLLLGSPEFQRR